MTKIKDLLQRNMKKISVCLYIAFIIYSCLMIWEVFIGPYRSYSGARRYNLYPFKTIIDFIENSSRFSFHVLFINLAANIITFIPLGFFMNLITKKSPNILSTFMKCTSIIIIIEIGQFILNVGVLDIDDVLLNSLGCALGILFQKKLRKFI